MKYLLFVCIGVFYYGCSLNAQPKDCLTVHEGVFKSISELQGDTTFSIITRKKDKQIEESKSAGIMMEFKVTWTSDCSYELSRPKVLKGVVDGVADDQILYVKIIDVRNDSFTTEVTTNFADFKLKLTYLIVK
jgi:hypothetical protein